MALPTVTARDLHVVQLSPQLRKVLKRRSMRAARRAYAPEIAADRANIAETRGQYRNQAASIRNASSMVQNALSHALAGAQASGLHGGYLRQLTHEIGSRESDTASAIPFLLADAQEERNKALSEGRQELRSARGSMLKAGLGAFNTLLKETRGEGSSLEAQRAEARKKKAQEAAEPGEGKYDQTNLENAKLALKDALSQWAKNPTVEGPDGSEVPLKQVNPLRTREDWLTFANGLVKNYDGFGLAEINHVLQEFLRKRARKENGVLGTGTGF